MWQTWKTMFLTNLLLIAAIEYIDLPKAGCDLVGSASGKHGLSQFLEQKLSTSFQRFDLDGDGVITREEYLGMGERFADNEKFDPVEKEALLKSFNDLYTLSASAAGTEGVNKLTEDLLIESMKMNKDNPQYKKVVGEAVLNLLNPLKLEQKHYFNFNEYRRLFESLGFRDVAFTKEGFDLIDANKDKKVSSAELFDATVAYMTSEDILSTALFGLLP